MAGLKTGPALPPSTGDFTDDHRHRHHNDYDDDDDDDDIDESDFGKNNGGTMATILMAG